MINGKICVLLRAPVLSLSGYGVAARQIFDYLSEDDRFLICLNNINWGSTPYIHNHPKQMKYYEAISAFHQLKDKVEYDIAIHCSIPNEFERNGKINIGLTAGIEVDRITQQWVQKCNEMDLIVVPSEFSKNVMSGTEYTWRNQETGQEGKLKIERPIQVIPHWFEKPKEVKPLDIKFSTNKNLLFVGLWGGKGGFGEDRKNIADLVRNFYMIFKDDASVGLVLKTSIVNNSETDKEIVVKRLNEIRSNFPTAKCKVHLIHQTLTDEELWSFYHHPQISGYVSLSHGEGFGLPMLEAVASGLPVVATNWSGHKDFCRDKKGYIPIEWEFVEIPECQVWEGVINKGSKWAKFNEADFKRKIKKFISNPSFNKKRAAESVVWIEENFSKEAVKKKWDEFFRQFIQEQDKELEQSLEELNPQQQKYLEEKAAACANLQSLILEEDIGKEKSLFIMPQSAGDVLISTAVVDTLIQTRHFDSPFYFAVNAEYEQLLNGLKVKYENFRVIPYDGLMMNFELTKEVWDFVYNPGVNVQYNFSNWLLGNGEFAVRLFEEFAKQCNLRPNEITNYCFEAKEYKIDGEYISFTPGGMKSAKNYPYWEDVLYNIKQMLPDVKIVQTGLKSEELVNGVDVDARGCSYGESIYIVQNALLHVGVDTFTAHVAAAVETPHVVVYGSTSATTVTPVILGQQTLQTLIETNDRHGCSGPCYKNECFNLRNGRNCSSNIRPEAVCNSIFTTLEKIKEEKKEE